MAKKTNKSEAIREALAQNPKATNKEILESLAAKGIKVTPTLIYFIKSKQNIKRKRLKRGKVTAASQRTKSLNPVELILKVKEVARDAGGFDQLKKLVDVLAE